MLCNRAELLQIVGMPEEMLRRFEALGLPQGTRNPNTGELVYDSDATVRWLILAVRGTSEFLELRRRLAPPAAASMTRLGWIMKPEAVALVLDYCASCDAAQ
jgi:hypothetical protein